MYFQCLTLTNRRLPYTLNIIVPKSFLTRSVIAQEVLRMNELTKKSKRELQKTDDREKVHKAWKQHMR